MKIPKVPKISKSVSAKTLLIVSVIAAAGYTTWQTQEIKSELADLSNQTRDLNAATFYDDGSEKGSDNAVTYKVLKQYVEKVDIMDPESNYKINEDITYDEKSVRVVEVEITNNNEWVFSPYASIGTIDETGRITRTLGNVRSSQDKNYSPSGYQLELAPGGKGITYLYFEDNGSEVTRLYDIDNAIELKDI